jgi:hypothetical protein
MALAIPLWLSTTIVAGFAAPATPPQQGSPWDQRTAEFLWSTIELHDPYPAIHLPSGTLSIFDQSAAETALTRLGGAASAAHGSSGFADAVRAELDPNTGYVLDNRVVSGPPVTWYALRALEAVGRWDAVDANWQARLLARSDRSCVILRRSETSSTASTTSDWLRNSPNMATARRDLRRPRPWRRRRRA